MKIAIISTGDVSNLKGIMNYVQEKIIQFYDSIDSSDTIEPYLILPTYSRVCSFLFRIRNHGKTLRMSKGSDHYDIDSVRYKVLWVYTSLLDICLTRILQRGFVNYIQVRRICKCLSNYDVICSHNLLCHEIAMLCSTHYKTPYISTWHGSDIHYSPYCSKRFYYATKNVIYHATYNLFVSKALMLQAQSMGFIGIFDVIYTGPSTIFRRFEDGFREYLKNQNKVASNKIVAYVGNLYQVKNVSILPRIFRDVEDLYDSVEFWIIGDGPERDQLKANLEIDHINFRLFGNVNPSLMPELYNCMDVLVIPSKNEGLPLTILESLACGVPVVGSNAGGIPEVIGAENSFPLNDDFCANVSKRILYYLTNDIIVGLPKMFSWESAIKKEYGICKQVTRH